MNYIKPGFWFGKLKTLILTSLSFPLYIIYLPIIFIIYIIGNSVILRFGVLRSARIGPFITSTEIYMCKKTLLEKGNAKKFIDFFYLNAVSNSYLKKMWKRKLKIFPKIFIQPFENLNKFFNIFFNFPKKHLIPHETERDVDDVLIKFKSNLLFTNEEEDLGEKFLKKIGLKKGQKFVCVLARDNDYLDKEFPRNNWDYHQLRNDNINNFSKAINLLNERGYYVFRMGKFAKQESKINNPFFMDYACSDYRSDFLDIFLASNCHFLLSSSCGFQAAPMIFKKPLACISFPFSRMYTWHPNCINITKHIYNGNKKINLKEVITTKKIDYYLTEEFLLENLKVVDNSPEEIKDLAEEMINFLENKEIISSEDEKLQKEFWNMFKSSKFGKYLPGRKLHGEFRARIGKKFLKDNFH